MITKSSHPDLPKGLLYALALGTFAVGTESFMIAGLLPRMAADLSVSVPQTGLLVTAFALTFAISGPLLAIFTGSLKRRNVLVGSMAMFAIGNALAFTSHSYASLMLARILLALTAGLYLPSANALASSVTPSHRGQALAIVGSGLTAAIVAGLPLGTLIGNHLGWRATFAAVAFLSTMAAAALIVVLPKGMNEGPPPASLKARATAVRLPGVLPTLLVTMFWGIGTYTVLIYLAPYLQQVAEVRVENMSSILLLWGLSSAVGLVAGGRATDRVGSIRVVVPTLALLAGSYYYLGILAFQSPWPLAIAAPGIVLWGLSSWAFYPAQQNNLVNRSGLALAPVVLSLNASFQYAGFSFGAFIGGLTVTHLSAGEIGWVGGGFELLALLLALLIERRNSAKTTASAQS